MMKRRMINSVSSKMQTLIQHLASLCSRCTLAAVANYSLFTILFALLISCDREPLELYKQGDSKVIIAYEWAYYNGPQPNGIFVMYAQNGNTITQSYPTNDLSGETNEQMPNGTYKQLVMTNTFQEYLGNMRFFNTDDYEKMRAVSNTYNITDMNAWDAGRQYLVEPMYIGVAVDSFDVKMDNNGLLFYEYDKDDGGVDTLHQEREDTIRSMVTTLTIRVKVRGINYINSPELGGVDGFIAGLADGFFLSQQWRTSEVGYIKLDHWRFDGYDTTASSRRAEGENDYKVGWIATDIQTFGLPHGSELLCQRTEKSNHLKLHFTRINGETIDFDYDVGKMVHYEGDDGTLDLSFKLTDVALQLNLEIDANTVGEDDVPTIPYTQPSGTGAFDAEVAPWGNDINVDVPM